MDNPSSTSCERPQDNTKVLPRGRAVITRYYSMMDDESVDDVFIPPAPLPPAPSNVATLLQAGGSTGATESNSSVTLANGTADATEAKANPDGLNWHQCEKQLMAAHNEEDEVIAGTSRTSKDSVDTVSQSNNCTPPTDQDKTPMEGTGYLMDPSGRNHQDNTGGEDKSDGEAKDIAHLSEGQGTCRETVDIEGHQTGKKDLVQSQGDSDNQTQVPEILTQVFNDDEEHVDTRSLNFNPRNCDLLRRESDTQECQLPNSEGVSKEYATDTLSPEMVGQKQQRDGRCSIETDIQQGEQLLQRLQLLQQRQSVDMSESPSTSQQEGEKDERAQTNLREKEKNERNESKDVETKEMLSSSTVPAQPEDQTETDNTDISVSGDGSPINTHETSSLQIPSLSTEQLFSDPETPAEQQKAAQKKKNLQRTGGVFNLSDDPDVLEIPFRTNISLEPLSSKVDPDLPSDRQFSEQKMQQEISQEIHREPVLVNQLQETKLLFEAFQQDNTQGPTRHKKPPTSLTKGQIYPTVLERTRSLEMFALKSCPVARAHSLRLHQSTMSEREKSPENLRSNSPTGGSRDKTRSSPYTKQDKHLRLHRSMDSISTDVSTSAVETRHLSREGCATQEYPNLTQNPFFKLRPALALKPEVEKDIREAREREEELRRQRCTLYGEYKQMSEDEEKSPFKSSFIPGSKQQSRGKLERVWPPPSKKDQIKSEQTQQEAKVHRAGGQKTPLWQRWESGLINSKPSKENN
ncbi:uncharacterized protein LOC122966830 [Scomber scombrus]|uniref:Uncharacterized protein LOC122966830 n=1 Tax=Scomber scombrus TaxID=13677 RepID=A0AAV1NM70_SCOSC